MNPQNDPHERRRRDGEHTNHDRRRPARRRAQKYNTKRTILLIVAAFAAVVLIALIGVAIWVNALLDDMIQNGGTSAPTQTDGSDIGQLPSGNTTVPPATQIQMEGVINIMLLGEDDDEGYGRGRTDSMILCTINPKAKTVKMTSFMRDLWVYIPGWGNNRLNAAYFFEGFDKLKETMLYNFGVEIDDFILVNYDVFTKVVDMLGGVDIELTEDEAIHLNNNYYVNNWALTAGNNRLNGAQALAYSRIRKIGTDFVRIDRQHKVIRSIFDAYKDKSVLELLSHAQQITPYLTLHMEKEDIFEYIRTMGPMLTDLSVVSHRIPADGTWCFMTTSTGAQVIEADMERNRLILAEILKP